MYKMCGLLPARKTVRWVVVDTRKRKYTRYEFYPKPISIYRVFPSNKQKQNWKIDTSLGATGAQDLFFSLYKLGVNFLWIREI